MSLGGSLEDLSLLDILQIVNVSRRTGVLRLDIPDMKNVLIYFKSGNVRDIVGAFKEADFLAFFEREGLVEAREIREAKEKAEGDDRRIIDLLVEKGVLNRRLLEQARGLELSRRLRRLTEENSGSFDFFLTETGDNPDKNESKEFYPLATPISPQNLLTQTVTADNFTDWMTGTAPPAQPIRGAVPSGDARTPPSASEQTADESTAPPPQATGEGNVSTGRDEKNTDVKLEVGAVVATPTERKPRNNVRVIPVKNQITILLAATASIFTTLLTKNLLEHFSGVVPVLRMDEYKEACKHLLDTHTPFISLVDLLMPSQDGEGYLGGLELVQASATHFPRVKVILMSDLQDEKVLNVARRHGIEAILQKPGLTNLRLEEFEQSIHQFAETFCRKADEIFPPCNEETLDFFRDLGVEREPDDRITDQLSLLKGLMGELASPKESSEISLLVLRLAAEYFERAILFLVKHDTFAGLGGFGETGAPERMMEKVRRMQIPHGKGSFFDDAVNSRTTVLRKKEDFRHLDKAFVAALGPYVPTASAMLPMVSRRRIIALLYGDNAVSGTPIPDLTGLEIFITQAGIAMEKALLEMQLLHLRRQIPPTP